MINTNSSYFSLFRNDLAVGIGLFVISLISRIPFRSHYLNSWDSGNFALGILDFNVSVDRPHPPGYPLYILAGKIIHLFFGNANTCLVLLSMISASLSVSLIYIVGKRIFDHRTGTIAVVLLFLSPLVWFQSEIALAHVVELPFVILATWLLYETFFNKRYAFYAAVVIGVGAGFRQDVFMFYGPVLFIATLRLGNLRKMLFVWISLLVSILVWLIPFLYLLGALQDYGLISEMSNHAALREAPIWNAGLNVALKNASNALAASIWLLGAGSVLIGLLFFQVIFKNSVQKDRRIHFLVYLTILPFLFFLSTGFTHFGYAMIYAPSLFLLMAYSLMSAVRGLPKQKVAALFFIVISILTTLNIWIYFRPEKLGNDIWALTGAYSNAGINRTDHELPAIIDTIRKYDSDSTLIILSSYLDTPYYFRQLIYYVPEYRVIWIRPDTGGHYHETIGYEEEASEDSPLQINISREFKQMLILGWREALNKGSRQKDVVPGMSAWVVPMEPEIILSPYKIKQI